MLRAFRIPIGWTALFKRTAQEVIADNQAHDVHPWDTPNTSHRHECVAWRRDRLSLVHENHVFGPVLSKCNYDFTMQAATLKLGDRQVTGARTALVTGIGGRIDHHEALVLAREAA